jgi:tRNA dimethylallyltransferase
MNARLNCHTLQVSLEPARETLHRNIELRLEEMLEAGFAEEVGLLMQRGDLHRDLPAMRAVGYRQMWDHLAGACDRKAMYETVLAATRQLAKRQITWLRAFEEVHRIDPGNSDPCEATLKLVHAVAIVASGS